MAHTNLERAFYDANAKWDRGDLRGAFKLFQLAANGGFKYAYNSLGYFYDHGYGTRRKTELALAWYRRGARVGDICALSNLGLLYEELGNHVLAQKWLSRAVQAGDGDAAYHFAKVLLASGRPGKSRSTTVRKLLKQAGQSTSITEANRLKAERLLHKLTTTKAESKLRRSTHKVHGRRKIAG